MSESRPPLVPPEAGHEMHGLARRLWPICRSLTGDGVRATLDIIREWLPMTVHEVPSGTPAFDWTVPKEWNIRDAYIADVQGRRVVDFRRNNLHVVSYSAPIRRRMGLADLRPHLHSLPGQPDSVPYRTAYYNENDWGFCLAHRVLENLADDVYDVCIDSTLSEGHLTYGECLLPGTSDEEVLIYTHLCHPSLANDNLAGLAVCTFLGRLLAARTRRYTYRLVFGPGTIGSLVWLSHNQSGLSRIRHGLVAVLLGHPSALRYKRSRRGDATIDRAASHVLARSNVEHRVEAFSPYGYDERQFCSPGFNLPVGRLSRSSNGGYPEYHTSADDLSLIQPRALHESLSICASVIEILEGDGCYLNTNPFGEPQLGRRGLYRRTGSATPDRDMAIFWILNQSDGTASLLDIAERASLPFDVIRLAADELEQAGLLVPVEVREMRPPDAGRPR